MPRSATTLITDPDFALLEILTDPTFPGDWALFDGRTDSLAAWVEDAGDHPLAPAALDQMLANGLSPLVLLRDGATTLLHLSVALDRLDLVQRLIARMRLDQTLVDGIDHRVPGESTALWQACNGGRNPAMVDLLLNAGADPRVQHRGRGLIWQVCDWGADSGRIQILQRLLTTAARDGFDQRATDSFGRGTALHKAIVHDNEVAIRLLVEAGADRRVEYTVGTDAEKLLEERAQKNPDMAVLLNEWRVERERQVLHDTLADVPSAPSPAQRRL